MTFEAKPMVVNDLPATCNVAVTLSQEAAAALNSVFNVTAFVPGLPIGTGLVRAIREYERHSPNLHLIHAKYRNRCH